ncbi:MULTISPECIES: hypothetical protein [unclassified Streptomyces]|uniref:hypothetical protein n=1 Tax=unclassified Streptomyces TaxID=2593676 RepID=UPI0037B5CC0C
MTEPKVDPALVDDHGRAPGAQLAQWGDPGGRAEARPAGDEGADGNGNEGQTGLQGAVAESELQPQRQDRDDAELADSDDQRGDIAAPERRDGEQAHIHQDTVRVTLVHQVGRGAAGPGEAEDLQQVDADDPAVRTSLDKAECEQPETGDGGLFPVVVEPERRTPSALTSHRRRWVADTAKGSSSRCGRCYGEDTPR